jgi:hypothetical protein
MREKGCLEGGTAERKEMFDRTRELPQVRQCQNEPDGYRNCHARQPAANPRRAHPKNWR